MNWKPQVNIRVSPHYKGEYESKISNGCISFSLPTYAEVKKKMKHFLEMSYTGEVTVSRSRRGEWGEWFETWSLVGGKPKITKKGWL